MVCLSSDPISPYLRHGYGAIYICYFHPRSIMEHLSAPHSAYSVIYLLCSQTLWASGRRLIIHANMHIPLAWRQDFLFTLAFEGRQFLHRFLDDC